MHSVGGNVTRTCPNYFLLVAKIENLMISNAIILRRNLMFYYVFLSKCVAQYSKHNCVAETAKKTLKLPIALKNGQN